MQVWVLENEGWSRRYSVYAHDTSYVWQCLAQPQVARDEFILTREWAYDRWTLYAHRSTDEMSHSGVVHIGMKERGTAVADISGCVRHAFSYVETTEPLGCYVQESTASV